MAALSFFNSPMRSASAQFAEYGVSVAHSGPGRPRSLRFVFYNYNICRHTVKFLHKSQPRASAGSSRPFCLLDPLYYVFTCKSSAVINFNGALKKYLLSILFPKTHPKGEKSWQKVRLNWIKTAKKISEN